VESSPVGILRELLTPNTVDASTVISDAAIVSSTTSTAPELMAPVVQLQPATDGTRSLISSKDTPLVMRRDLGRGMADQLAFDPTLAPIRDWPDRRMIFAGLLGGQVGTPGQVGPLRAEGNAENAARALPGAALPPFLIVAGFLLLYVLTIGPINFFFLRKLNRLAWAWVTVPGTVILFAMLGYATGFRLRGNEPEVHRLSIVNGEAGLTEGRAESIIGLFSPRRTVLDVSTGDNLAQEIQPNPNVQDTLSFRFSSPNQLEKVVATNNDVRAFYLQGVSQLPNVQADIHFIPGRAISDTARLAGEIRNESNASLTDCVLTAGKDYHVIGNIGPHQRVQAEVQMQLGRPEMGFAMPTSRLSTTGYASSMTSSFGRSAPSSAPVPSYHSPFDLDGAPLSEALLNWRNFKDDRLKEEAERGLLAAVYDNPNVTVGQGANLACWEDQDYTGVQVTGANYTDRGLRIWRLPIQPFLAGHGTALPADAFKWSVLSSSSAVAIDENGMDMDVGDHVIGLTPWFSMRTTGPVSVTLGVGTSLNSSTPALLNSSVWLYDWETLKFTQVITSLSGSTVEMVASGPFLSPSGELRARVDVREDQITLTNIQAQVQTP
jgi:hypothetical protein